MILHTATAHEKHEAELLLLQGHAMSQLALSSEWLVAHKLHVGTFEDAMQMPCLQIASDPAASAQLVLHSAAQEATCLCVALNHAAFA